jgi:hypothetical protein
MRVMLSTNDGELLAEWNVPDSLTDAEIEDILGDGLSRKHRLDRCDECGSFVPRDTLVERDDAHGPHVICAACAKSEEA